MEYRVTMKNLPEEARPRERLAREGAEVLSDIELLAVLIRSGSREETALELAGRILAKSGGLTGLVQESFAGLCSYKGMGEAKASSLAAAIEVGKRIATTGRSKKAVITKPDDVANLVMEEMRHFDREYFKVISLNTKNEVLAVDTVSVGSLNSSIVHPRELFKKPIKRSSAALILVHNHPSGDPTPSREDIDVTRRLWEAGNLLGIEILDHVVIGDRTYVSLRERGLI